MAFVYDTSFEPSGEISSNQPYLAADMNELHDNINKIMTKISGPPVITSEGRLYQKVPAKLGSVHGLRSNYKTIWDDTIVSYEPETYGASADLDDYYVMFGYFFTKPQPLSILEKVLWHEVLHLIVDLPRPMHHGRINQIIKYGLHLKGDPNPLGTVGLEC